MGSFHIFRAKDQPATRYVVDAGGRMPFTIAHSPRTCIRCFKCHKQRWAANLIVHVYYDGTYFFCAPGKGCKA